MSFKRIEVTGFKSFADSLSIEFDSGITAIVGPNGCGKSNIADAIRWGLGEQSSKLLRGDNMQDVIFKGAEGRKGLSYCEVALVFDNSDNRFNLDYDEVVISRKLFRSGDREYALNRSPCLLKDINNILHDSGIGRDGYSIIGQGRVEQIVSSKPEHRREIFEEAAGIAKHKERKTEAERKLANTRDNIVRLQDIYSEVERQLAPMQKQAETAKKFLGLREELKIHEVNHYIYTYENAERNKRQIAELIEGLQQEAEYKSRLVADAVEKHNNSLDGIKNIDEQIKTLSDQMLALSVGLEKQAGDYRLAQAKLDYMREQSEKLQAELKSQKAEFELLNTQLLDKQSQKSTRLDNLEALRAQADEIQKVYLAVVGQINASEDLMSGNQSDLNDTITKLTDIKTTISRLQAEIKALGERDGELIDKQQSLSTNLDSLNASLVHAQDTKNDLDSQRKMLKDSITALRDNIRNVEMDKHALNADLSANLDKLAQLKMRQKMLNEMQAEYEGYNGTVRKLLVDVSKNTELQKQVVGVVAQLMTVPREYETAIEMALGAGVQNIVTNNEVDAKKLVAYLKSNNYGRATFLPINSIKPKFINDSLRGLLSTQGCLGIASDLITYDDKLAPIFRGLLGSTVIVDNMDTAVKLANDSRFGFKIVTLEGDIINPAGSITGGSKKSVINNLLSRDREIEEVNNDLEKMQNIVDELQIKMDKYTATHTQLLQELDNVTTELHNCEIELTQAEDNYNNIKTNTNSADAELHSVMDDRARITTRIQLLQSELDTSLQLDKVSELPSNGIQKADNSYTLLRKQRDELSEKLTSIKITIATQESECTSLDAEIERLLGEQARLNESIDENTSLLIKNTKTMETAISLSNGATDDTAIAQDKEKLESVKNEIAELTKLKGELHLVLDQIEKERTAISTELSKVQEKIF
ncbi:MAG: chromosome segregation protein SMC [Clostridia bacterium]|nr:chromosome segregation protein SMC [Clostridia bacterium]